MTKIRSTDDSHVQDRRGQGGGGGFCVPGHGRWRRDADPGGKAGGGGLIGLLVVAAIIFLPRLLGSGAGTNLITPDDAQEAAVGNEGEACQTEIEQIVCGANEDVQDYWESAYPQAFGEPYDDTELVLFSGGTNTGCGAASSQTGPFYCPADALVYIDLDFMDQLQNRLRGAWRLGHGLHRRPRVRSPRPEPHRQNAAVQQASGDTQRLMGIALELQADCYAGAWVHDADRRSNEAGEDLIDQDELAEALNAAAAVGDDRIQLQMQGRVDSDSFTHGTSEQREGWFRRGYETGDPTQCDTFAEL